MNDAQSNDRGKSKDRGINKWVNKQLWRVKQTYAVFQPMLSIIQLLLWAVIAIGISEWFTLTWETFTLSVFGLSLIHI